jgi:hypothetical protein
LFVRIWLSVNVKRPRRQLLKVLPVLSGSPGADRYLNLCIFFIFSCSFLGPGFFKPRSTRLLFVRSCDRLNSWRHLKLEASYFLDWVLGFYRIEGGGAKEKMRLLNPPCRQGRKGQPVLLDYQPTGLPSSNNSNGQYCASFPSPSSIYLQLRPNIPLLSRASFCPDIDPRYEIDDISSSESVCY